MKADKFSPGDDVTEPLLKQLDIDIWQNHEKHCPTITERNEKKDSKLLILSFVAMVFVGLGNKVMQKVQTEPMKNYPYFLNIYTTFIFIPASFVYIIPMIMLGKLSEERKEVPQFKYLVMGFLDGFASTMQIFAVTKIASGSLLILLSQAAIPISMLISRLLLKASYTRMQYLGALLVMCGIGIVLGPRLTEGGGGGGGDGPPSAGQGGGEVALWSAVMILSCVPMTLSSVFKEMALNDIDLDPMYLNGYIALYQFVFCLLAAAPAAVAVGLPVADVPSNCWDGLLCYLGRNSIVGGADPAGDDDCGAAPAYVNLYLAFNIVYNILMILILKYGSANLLFLALTVTVPMGNLAFAIPWMPGSRPLTVFDGAGLAVIMLGLVVYRFLAGVSA
mmetsp:Transcript_40571/g.84740  ORF Transcript_40571/g.84740 Transcript_40571/m.84740 type:complete len:391 (-) Transcript_40571:337-1509(-)